MSNSVLHQSFSLTLFSAQQYYAEVNGEFKQACAQSRSQNRTTHTPAEIPSTAGTVTAHLSVPLTGVLYPQPAQAEAAQTKLDATTLWLDGVVHQAQALQELLVALRAGELPPPLTAPSTLPAGSTVGYVNPGSLATERTTLAAALGVLPALARLVWTSPSTRCQGCGAAVQRYQSPTELVQGICTRWDPRAPQATLELSAPSETLTPWCLQHGFTLHDAPGGLAHTILDTLTAPSENAEQLVRVFTRVWQLPDPWQLLIHPAQHPTIQLSRTGICTHCDRIAAAPSLARLTKLLGHGKPPEQSSPPQTRNEHPEQLLELAGIPLIEILNTPLSEITSRQGALSSVLSKIFPPQLLHDLTLLRLDHCALGTRIDSLSGAALTRLALLISLHQRSTITVTKLPGRVLNSDPTLAASVQEILSHHATTSLRVILTEPDPTAPSHIPVPNNDTSPTACEITVNITVVHPHLPPFPLTISIQKGHTTTFATPRELELLPLSSLITEALTKMQPSSPQPPPLPTEHSNIRISAACNHSLPLPFHLHHIPLFPAPPHSPFWCVAQELGIYELIAELYASGVTARMQGIQAQELSLNPRAKVSYHCPGCRGAGVSLHTDTTLGRPVAAPCSICHGRRFRAPASHVEFRGEPLWHLLNSTLQHATPTLSALRGSGARLQLLRDLDLLHLPLGLPLSLLPDSERRRLKLARAILNGTRTTPSILVLEEPFADLTPHQATEMHKVLYGQGIPEDLAGSIFSIVVVTLEKS